jgi:hypothetical protein
MVKTKLTSNEEKLSSSNNKKTTLQTRKEAKEKLRQDVVDKLEKKYDFLRNLENQEASEISDEDIVQLKKE